MSTQRLHKQLPSLLTEEWDYEKNYPLKPEDFLRTSEEIVFWKSKKCGHGWPAKIIRRVYSKSGCYICSSKIVSPGINDLASLRPDLAAEWHPTKNGNLTPDQVMLSSTKIATWLANCGHDWETIISSRTSKNTTTGCPVCFGSKIVPGINDLATLYPNLIKEWDWDQNVFLPSETSAGSHVKAQWSCLVCSYTWPAVIETRVKGANCPRCSGKVLSIGINDFASQRPDLLIEWDYGKNLKTPDKISVKSNSKAHWRCSKCNHKWIARVSDRANGSGCNECKKRNHQSKPELEIQDTLRKIGYRLETSNTSLLKGFEIDIYLPDYKIGIEHNGLYWHSDAKNKNPSYHYEKWIKSRDADITLLQIWEDEWRDNKSLVEKLISQKIDESILKPSNTFKRIPLATGSEFLRKNSLELMDENDSYLGYFDENNLLFVIAFKNQKKNNLVLIKNCSIGTTASVLEKAVFFLEQEYKNSDIQILTDNRFGFSRECEKLGFTPVGSEPPKCQFLYKDNRYLYPELISISDEQKKNKVHLVWDAGYTKWTV